MFTKTDIEKYFLAEKQASMLFIVVGAIAVVLALLFFFLLRGNFYKGAALPLILIGLIELGACITVYRRSDEDRVRNVYAYDANPYQLKNTELPRMKKVNSNFVIYRWMEVLFLLGGGVLVVYFRTRAEGQFWFGLGITLGMQAAILFGADYMGAQRAAVYTKGLEAFTAKLG